MEEISAEEQTEIDEAKSLSDDIKYLMKNPQFQRVIMKRYIEQTALVVGSSFSGQPAEVEALKAVSQLKYFLDTNE